MSNQKLFRLSGICLILSGILSPLAQVIHPPEESLNTILTQTWRLVTGHVLMTTAILLGLIGLVGLYLFQAGKSGRLGLLGFFLAFTGNILLAVSGNYGYIAPVLAKSAPDMLNAINMYPPELWLDVLMVLTYIIGFILLGIATVRARQFPRLSGWLIAIGPILFFIFSGISLAGWMIWLYYFGVFGQLLFGLGLILAGRILLGYREVIIDGQVIRELPTAEE